MMVHDVFISYAYEDKHVADAICAKLEADQIRCWIAPRDIAPGDKYASALIHALDNSEIIVIVFSSRSNKSPHVRTEIERAFNKEKIIIPFRIENIEPTDEIQYFIGIRHWLDALTPPLEDHIYSLIKVIRKNLVENDKSKEEEHLKDTDKNVISKKTGFLDNLDNKKGDIKSKKTSYVLIGIIVVSILIVCAGIVAITWDGSHAFFGTDISNHGGLESVTSATTSIPLSTPPTTTDNFLQSQRTTTYPFVFRGSQGSIEFTTYSGLADLFSKEDHSYYYSYDKETVGELLENDLQNENLRPFIQKIQEQSTNSDDQAKIAISLVQHIPFDTEAINSEPDWYYPYETLYRNKGVCGDKAILLAYLLNKLGYDTVLFQFDMLENGTIIHMTVGVKTSSDYDFYDTGYAFIEATRQEIPTYIPDTYYANVINSHPHIIHLNGGKKSIDFSVEYHDAISLKQLEGRTLDESNSSEYMRIINNYNL